MRLTFCGGARSVTGSNYLIEASGQRIIVDCGLFQGTHFSEALNYDPFPYDPAQVAAAVITHSHADHTGRLPKLYRDGFRGRIFATEPSKGIMNVAVYDTLEKITDEAPRDGHEPLYHKKDVAGVLELVSGVRYGAPVNLGTDISGVFHEASHILGAAIVEILVGGKGEPKRFLFSGDLGNPPTQLLNPIDYVSNADGLVIESAYGDRLHEDREKRRDALLGVITETVKRRGVLLIPSFAVERTQELLLEIDGLFEEGILPRVPIFLDSPLAQKITEVYGRFSHYFNPAAIRILEDNQGLFRFPWLKFTPSVDESKAINDVPPPKIIIAGSGMSQGGRILHHELRYLPGPENTILFIGYQVKGTLGRKILDGEAAVSILGELVPVHCLVRAIPAYSAHADQNGLLTMVRKAAQGGRLKRVFVVQGEEEVADLFAKKITRELAIPAEAPQPGQSVEL